MITTASMKAGFTGGLVVDYPNSSKVLKLNYHVTMIMIMTVIIVFVIINMIPGEEVFPCANDWRSSTIASSAWRGDWS